MSAARDSREEPAPPDEARIEEEEDAAAAEAGKIGGDVPPDSEDPAMQPLYEAGEGEQEGFELAEKDLEDIAGNADRRGFPADVPGRSEERENVERGEADQEIPPDGPETEGRG